jgi:isoamylase
VFSFLLEPISEVIGVNFAIFSRHATCVWLELFDGPEDKTPIRVIVLDPIRHRTDDAWYAWVSGPDPAKRDTGP